MRTSGNPPQPQPLIFHCFQTTTIVPGPKHPRRVSCTSRYSQKRQDKICGYWVCSYESRSVCVPPHWLITSIHPLHSHLYHTSPIRYRLFRTKQTPPSPRPAHEKAKAR
ncbi:hypothetical protein BCR34DRAFT_390787 [Clohesyomyces aquaticus]|uniref:Uncharacterized protein n=1 Tax=Clohesyomyces aquaticus TaxID=1231657 RepID=A0A1Y1ZEF4_9PLEO|nr:hypothetical protein BCR34DRAFT_390787 [Clohesyomyces aquaticus]